jgi:hypothetical protein
LRAKSSRPARRAAREFYRTGSVARLPKSAVLIWRSTRTVFREVAARMVGNRARICETGPSKNCAIYRKAAVGFSTTPPISHARCRRT